MFVRVCGRHPVRQQGMEGLRCARAGCASGAHSRIQPCWFEMRVLARWMRGASLAARAPGCCSIFDFVAGTAQREFSPRFSPNAVPVGAGRVVPKSRIAPSWLLALANMLTFSPVPAILPPEMACSPALPSGRWNGGMSGSLPVCLNSDQPGAGPSHFEPAAGR